MYRRLLAMFYLNITFPRSCNVERGGEVWKLNLTYGSLPDLATLDFHIMPPLFLDVVTPHAKLRHHYAIAIAGYAVSAMFPLQNEPRSVRVPRSITTLMLNRH